MLSKHRFCCYMCLPNALLLRGLRILPTILYIDYLVYIDYFYLVCIGLHSVVDILVDFEPMYPGFESRELHEIFFIVFFLFFFLCFFFFCHYYYNANLQIQHYCL